MEETIKDRISKFIRYRGLKTKQFETICGLSNGYIKAMRKGFGREKLENVLSMFPELNREWLLYGEGEMLKTNTHNRTIISGTGNINNNSVNSPIENSIFHCCNDEHASAEIEKLKKQVEELRDKCNILSDANKHLIDEKQFYQEHIKELMKILSKKGE